MEPFIGEIQLFPYMFCPLNWMECRGQVLSIMEYQELFALIGNKYGGDGRTNFALPNLKNAEPVQDMCYCIALKGTWPPRS